MNRRHVALLAASLTFASVLPAQTLVSTPFSGTQATNFSEACEQLNGICFSTGPLFVGANGFNVTMTSNQPTAYGQLNTGFGDNGQWFARKGIAATTLQSHIVSLAFATPVTHIGAYMNYLRGLQSDAPLLRIFDATNQFQGEFDLSMLAPITFAPTDVDEAAFRGISYLGGISRLEISGGVLALTDLIVRTEGGPVPVPEPTSLTLFPLASALLLGAIIRRRRLA
jgi:hypothetical protein